MIVCTMCGKESEHSKFYVDVCPDCGKIRKATKQREYYQKNKEHYVEYARNHRKEVSIQLTDKRKTYLNKRDKSQNTRRLMLKQYPPTCYICNCANKLALHHINLIPDDNRYENLVQLCYSCHKRIHSGAVELKL